MEEGTKKVFQRWKGMLAIGTWKFMIMEISSILVQERARSMRTGLSRMREAENILREVENGE